MLSEETLKSDNIRVNKKKIHKSKKPIDLMSVNVDQMVVSDKFKHSGKGFKYFIGYQEDEIVKPLCIILPQMSGYTKYLENGSKSMPFLIKDDKVWENYNHIWDVIKNKLGIKFHSVPVYDEKYLKTKIREHDGKIKTKFGGNDVPKENMHYRCIACITINSVMKIEKKNYPQVYLEERKYKIRKIQMSKFIISELDSDWESDAELMTKSKSDSDNDSK